MLIAIVLILLGLCLIQFGGKYYMASMCITAAFLMTCIMMCILYGIVLPHSTPMYIVWMSLFFCMGVGAGMAYGVYNWPKVGIVTVGLIVGSFFGSLIYTLFLSEFTGNSTLRL